MEKRQILTLTVLRQKVGLTQTDIALAIGKSQTEISLWEKGDRTLSSQMGLAILSVIRSHDRSAAAGVSPADLTRPWDEVLLERSNGKSAAEPKKPATRAGSGHAGKKRVLSRT